MRALRLAPLVAAALLTSASLAFASPSIADAASPLARTDAPVSADGHVGTGHQPLGFVAGELIVQLKDSVPPPGARMGSASALGASSDSLARVLQRAKARDYQVLARPLDTARMQGARALSAPQPQQRARLARLVKLRIDGDVNEAVEQLRQDPDVEFAEPNYIARASYTPNDPYYASSGSWGQNHQDLWGLQQLNLGTAWDTAQGRGIVVAVIDSGLDAKHEDIAANVWHNPNEIPGNGIDDDGNGYIDDVTGWDFVSNDNRPQDGNGHGTHVAGTIAAVADNGVGIVGVAPKAKILPLRGLGDNGTGSYADLIAALIYAADMGAHVINNSLGGEGESQALRDAVNYARERGSVVIAAAGNDSRDVATFTPANLDGVISVGALNPINTKAGFSNYGARVDVFAPGDHILSLAASGTSVANHPDALQGKYAPLSGTSMAAPHVAGIAALILERFPTLNPDQVRKLLRDTTSNLGDIGWDTYYGFGRVEPVAALQHDGALPRLRAGFISPSPLPGPERSLAFGRDRFTISGTAGGADFAGFELAYAPMEFDSAGGAFTTFASGQGAVSEGLLGELDASGLPDGRYLLRLRSRDASGRSIDSFQDITKDSSLLPGWPMHLGNTGSNTRQSVLFADLDGDGNDEVIASSGAYLYAWSHDGQPLNGFPKRLGTVDHDPLWGSSVSKPSVGDLDGDGDLEIVVHVSKRIYRTGSGDSIRPLEAFHHTGEPVAGFPAAAYPLADIPEWLDYLHPRNGSIPPVIADLDGDGRSEIVLTHGTANTRYVRTLLTVVGSDGKTLPGWPKFINDEHNTPHRPPVVGDLDGDGLKEIIAFDGRVYPDDQGNAPELRVTVYGHDGAAEARRAFPIPAEVPFYYPDHPEAAVVLADIDANGHKELVINVPGATLVGNTWEATSSLHLLDARLADLPGWPRTTLGLLGAMVTNLDDDPALEFLALTDGSILRGYDSDGSELPGYPINMGYALYNTSGLWRLIEGGLEVDGSPIYLTGMIGNSRQTGRFEGLVAFDKHGHMLPGYPKNLGWGVSNWPAAAKPGSDSSSIAYMTLNNVIYAFRQAGTPLQGWTQFQGNSRHTGEDGRSHPQQQPVACSQFTASNAQHVTAGRAHKVTTGTFWPTTTYYANGSNDNLGTLGTTQVTLAETAPGHFKKGSCPATGTRAPQLSALFGRIDEQGRLIASGSAWDADGDLSRVEVKLNNEATWRQASGTGSWTLNLGALGNGPHTLQARAVDAGGRVSAIRGPISVTASAIEQPSAPVVDYIYTSVAGRSAYVSVSAYDVDGDLERIELRVDNGAWQTLNGISWPELQLTDLAVGVHTVEARATDRGGRTGSNSTTFEVLPDTAPSCTASQVSLEGEGLHYAWLHVEDANFDLTGGEARVDGGEWKPAFNFFGLVVVLESAAGELAPGTHTLEGRAFDASGLVGECPTITFEVAAPTAPTVDGLSVGVETEGKQKIARFNGQASDPNRDIVRVELELNGNGTWLLAEGTEWFYYNWENPAGGIHTVRARAVDSQGLTSEIFGPVSFEAGPGPSAPRVTALQVLLDGPRVTVRGNAADADGDLARVELEFDGNGQWLTVNGTATWSYFSDSLAAGAHTVRARAFDKTDRVSSVYGPIGFSVTTGAASAPVIDSLSATVVGQQVTVGGTASDADGDLLRVEIEFDGNGQWLSASGSGNFSYSSSSLAPGSHSVRARGVDAGNRTGTPSAPVSFTIAAPSTQCFTASNSAHAAAGRATLKYSVLYYANGSNDYLGMASNTSSLQQQSANSWKKVTSCP